MNNKTRMISGIVLVILVVIGVYWFTTREQDNNIQQPQAVVNSYEECVAAEYPVLESFPEQCRTPDGRVFVRSIEPTDEPQSPTNIPDEGNPEIAIMLNAIGEKRDLIFVNDPQPMITVASPLIVRGEARGTWYFEATFPVRLEDGNGNILVQSFATAQREWMTEDFVPFEAELTFTAPQTDTGILILEKNNPSGLEEQADELRIPIRFIIQ